MSLHEDLEDATRNVFFEEQYHGYDSYEAERARRDRSKILSQIEESHKMASVNMQIQNRALLPQEYHRIPSSQYVDEPNGGLTFILFSGCFGQIVGFVVWMYYFPSFVGFVLSVIGMGIGAIGCGVVAFLVWIVVAFFEPVKKNKKP